MEANVNHSTIYRWVQRSAPEMDESIVEQDRRFVRWRVKASQYFKNFWSAQRTLRGYETINMIRKEQLDGFARGDVVVQTNFINQLFGIAA